MKQENSALKWHCVANRPPPTDAHSSKAQAALVPNYSSAFFTSVPHYQWVNPNCYTLKTSDLSDVCHLCVLHHSSSLAQDDLSWMITSYLSIPFLVLLSTFHLQLTTTISTSSQCFYMSKPISNMYIFAYTNKKVFISQNLFDKAKVIGN